MSTAKHYNMGLIATLVVIGLCCLSYYDPYRYTSVCVKCGALRSATVFQLPLSDVELFQHTSIHESILSKALTNLHLVSKHDHHWMMAHGGGHRILCALGKGRHVAASATDNDVPQLIIASRQFEDAGFTDNLVQRALDSRTTQAVWQLAKSLAAVKPANKNDFEAWKVEEAELISTLFESSSPVSK